MKPIKTSDIVCSFFGWHLMLKQSRNGLWTKGGRPIWFSIYHPADYGVPTLRGYACVFLYWVVGIHKAQEMG